MDYEEAMACFSAAENNGEDARLIARGRGIASIGQTNYEDAVTYLEDCLALSDGVVEKWMWMSTCIWQPHTRK